MENELFEKLVKTIEQKEVCTTYDALVIIGAMLLDKLNITRDSQIDMFFDDVVEEFETML